MMGEENTRNADEKSPEEQVNSRSDEQDMKWAGEN